MICQRVAACGLALTLALVTPAKGAAQSYQDDSNAVEAAADPPAQLPQMMPVSYSLSSDVNTVAIVSNTTAPVPSRGPALASTKAAELRLRRIQAEAVKWEIAYLALSAIDAAQTIECIGRGACTELNPLFGKRPSATKIILAKTIGGALHFWAFSHLNKRNPKAALRGAQISAGLQGAVLVLNARVAF